MSRWVAANVSMHVPSRSMIDMQTPHHCSRVTRNLSPEQAACRLIDSSDMDSSRRNRCRTNGRAHG